MTRQIMSVDLRRGPERVSRVTESEPAPVRFDDTIRAVAGWERHSMLTTTRVEPTEERDSGWLVEPHESEPGTGTPRNRSDWRLGWCTACAPPSSAPRRCPSGSARSSRTKTLLAQLSPCRIFTE